MVCANVICSQLGRCVCFENNPKASPYYVCNRTICTMQGFCSCPNNPQDAAKEAVERIFGKGTYLDKPQQRRCVGALEELNEAAIAELFHNGIAVVMLIDRGIGNCNKGSKRWLNKLISFDKESFEMNVEKLIAQQDYLGSSKIRLYASLNYRSLDKGIKNFIRKLLDLHKNDAPRFWAHINANFVSSLMQPESRVASPKRWLLDVDTLDEEFHKNYSIIRQVQGIKVLWEYGTVNGKHFIVEPFNKAEVEIPEKVELKQDGLILLRAFKD